MNFSEEVEFWKQKYLEQEKSDSECGEVRREIGSLLLYRSRVDEEIEERMNQIARIKHHWWYGYKLKERIIKKFNVKKRLPASKRAFDYYNKYAFKPCKMKFKLGDNLGKDSTIGFLEARISQVPDEIKNSYRIVLKDLMREEKDV